MGVATGLLVAVAVGGAALALAGWWRWRVRTQSLRARLQAARQPVEPVAVDLAELADLPEPVQRYLRLVLTSGEPLIEAVRVRHRGTFNLSADGQNWRPFRSEQRVVCRRPGFDWNGRVTVLPGLDVRVHDAYVAGEGVLEAALLGLVPVANLTGSPEIAAGELMRYLAEAAWYPTALLPSQGVEWTAHDATSAWATLADGLVEARLLVRFGADGLIESVRAEDRARAVGDAFVPTPWEGRFWDYRQHDSRQIPYRGEVAWLLPEGELPYWRGEIEQISVEAAGEDHRV